TRLALVGLILTLLLFSASWGRQVEAAESEDLPERLTSILVTQEAFEWWLIRWKDNQFTCQIFTDHENLPSGQEVFNACGNTVYTEWVETPPCESALAGGEAVESCSGLYLHNVGHRVVERLFTVDLPTPKVWIDLANCNPIIPENLCREMPSLLFTGEEPLPNEQITAIHVSVDGVRYTCEGETCVIPLQPTTGRGVEIVFWADSSFGDSSNEFSALVRLFDSGVPSHPGGGGWYIDVLSSQWLGGATESCAQMWKTFPTVGIPPRWLSTPTHEDYLASSEPYHYLAGRLIAHNLVDTEGCPDAGLLPNGYANPCGLERARNMVDLWQNRFDPLILKAADETGLPAQLMKNLFAQESQFWPGEFRIAQEYGLGQLTDMGADTVLLWNQSFYSQFCPLVLENSVCARGYLKLNKDEQAILRGALAVHTGADCPDCPEGVDLDQADFSVMIFAQSILANCSQVSRTVYNATRSSPGEVSGYADLWRFTLANYNAGAGCLAHAIHTTWQQRLPLTWDHVSTNFTEACQGAITYVENITK
ncbi:MAG: hypothetical protein IBX69_13185, partial [Anaerolineales bacterium]|nr:hypothetical protein [Anaerolineales bacterium]